MKRPRALLIEGNITECTEGVPCVFSRSECVSCPEANTDGKRELPYGKPAQSKYNTRSQRKDTGIGRNFYEKSISKIPNEIDEHIEHRQSAIFLH